MQHPEAFYALAVGVAVATEAGFRVMRRDAFGPVVWVIAGVVALSWCAYWSGMDLPRAQLVLHCLGLVLGMVVARGFVGHVSAGLFFPMAMIDGLAILKGLTPAQWWWALFYIAVAQLIALGAGADFHPVGRSIRAWSDRVHQRFERLAWGDR